MRKVPRSLLVCFALFSLVLLSVACGGSDTAATADGDDTDVAVAGDPATEEKAEAGKSPEPINVRESASVIDAFRDAAALQGIYFKEVPEGFPLNIIPLHPDGEIDKSSVNEEDFTLLQVIAGDKDGIFGWYKDHFEGLGFEAGNPFTMGTRTMVGFGGSDGEVSMTLSELEDGKIFVSLVLSQS